VIKKKEKKMVPDVSREKILVLFRTMLTIRRFEEALIKLTKSGVSVGHFHVYIGQECTGAPTLSLYEPGDTVVSTHRNHGHLLARGADPGRLMAEILGRATGYNKGKGGTLHVTVRELGFLSSSGIVGESLPLATGAAFAAKQKKTGCVSFCFFGDGALEEGVSYESMNLAALWSLPVIYLCENNSEEALATSAGEYPGSTIAIPELTTLAKTFNIPAVAVDGADVGEVYRAVREAVGRARAGQGPSFIEAKTVRSPVTRFLWPDLVAGEMNLEWAWSRETIPHAYKEWHESQDGLLRFTRELLQAGLMTPDTLLQMDRDVRAEMEKAVEYAQESPYPDPQSALDDVFV
jgi:TPP-dependent pyruvate/acetoin dehydrogenase alpha subunit